MLPVRLARSSSIQSRAPDSLDDQLLKVVVIGDVTVGKTSLIQRYVNNTYKEGYKATIGVDFSLKQIRWSNTCSIKLQLWDIAGQERFASITRAYYRGADGCFLLFDLSNSATLRRAARWKEDLDAKCRLPDGSPVPCLLLANKSDLRQRQVTKEEIRDLCQKYAFVGCREVSVKDNINVAESVRFLVDIIMGQSHLANSPTKTTQLQDSHPAARRKFCAC